MNDISEIFNVAPDSWIDTLSTYQKILFISFMNKLMTMKWWQING